MIKQLTWGLICAAFSACGGGSTMTETPLDPQLTLVTPSAAFAGRVVDLQISAAEMHFDATSLVSLNDPGITISNVAVGSSENLRLTATLASTAQLGPHDVTVTTAGATVRLTGGFTVRAALGVEPPPAGMTISPAVQGGLTTIYTRNLDYVQNPWSPSPLNTRLVLGLNSVGGALLLSGARYATTVLVDALAPAGMAVVPQGLSTNPLVQPMVYVADPLDPNLPRSAARTPTAMTSGAALPNQLFDMPNDSGFYTLTSTQDNQILLAQVSALGSFLTPPNGSMQGAVAPAMGRYTDGNFTMATYNAAGTTGTLLGLLGSAGPQFLSLWQGSFGGGMAAQYGYTLTPKVIPGNRFTMVEPATPDMPATPLHTIGTLDTTAGYYSTDGAFDRQGDTDYILYTAPAAVNRILVTVAAPGAVVNIIEYLTNTCTSVSSGTVSANHFAALEVTSSTTQRCIAISTNTLTQRFPTPYKVIIAAL